MAGNLIRAAGEIGRADRLVRLLRILCRAAVDPRLARHVAGAELAADEGACGGDRLGGDGDAVGAHIADEADGIAFKLDALVEPLRHPHRPARAEAELA